MSEKFDRYSFSSANTFPLKLLRHDKMMHNIIYHNRILPIHIQLNSTNRCNFDCSFCSCSAREKNVELPIGEVEKVMEKARDFGCEACTSTGGGEPLCYSKLDRLLEILDDLDIEVGLVTNGVLLDRVNGNNSENIAWCRISSSDELTTQLGRVGKTTDQWFATIDRVCKESSHIGWAFSHVLTAEKGNPVFIKKLVEFANNHNFTHVRIVSDILNAEQLAEKMEGLKAFLESKAIDASKVNFQGRSAWTRGRMPCWIPLVKPVLSADNFWFACCGSQYVKLDNPKRDYEPLTRISKFPGVKGLMDFVENQRPFDGRVCDRCYYDNYNQLLEFLKRGRIKHVKFV